MRLKKHLKLFQESITEKDMITLVRLMLEDMETEKDNRDFCTAAGALIFIRLSEVIEEEIIKERFH